jgi:Fur family peroxide stress response transcriptional regulator
VEALMDRRIMEDRIRDLEAICRERGIPCTLQRRIVLEAVLGRLDHPSADQVFEAVQGSGPGISRATVHRTLDFLAGLGLISKACHPGRAARYDATTESHHHLVCMHCERMIDFEDDRLGVLEIPDTSAAGFVVTDYRVQLRGICRHCRDNDNNDNKQPKEETP